MSKLIEETAKDIRSMEDSWLEDNLADFHKAILTEAREKVLKWTFTGHSVRTNINAAFDELREEG